MINVPTVLCVGEIKACSYPKSLDSQCEQSDLIQADSFLMQDSSNKDKYNDKVCAMTLV